MKDGKVLNLLKGSLIMRLKRDINLCSYEQKFK